MEKTMKARVQHKHDIEANWLKATNFIPLASEIIVYDPDENYDYPRIKIGDGETNINALPFVTKDYAKISDIPTKPEDIGALPDSTIIPTVPTKISAFENDKGYLTQHQSLDAYAKTADLGALATKDSLTASDVGALPDTTKIPSTLADLTADSTHRTVTDTEKNTWNAKANPSDIPTKVSDLTNDKGYITSYTETDPTVPAWAKADTKPTYTASEVGALPSTTKIPGALSDLSEDTTHRVVTDAEKEAWNAKSNFSGSYNDLTNKPTIPSVAGLASTTYVDDAVKNKVDKDGNKVLSTNDYTTAEKNKLAGIAAGAEVNVNADWNATSGDARILNKPTLGSMATKSSVAKSDLTSGVQTSLDKADSALQPSDISDWAKQPSKPGYTKSEVGLGNVDNTSDANKPVSTAQATAIADAKKAGTDAQGNLATHTNNKSNPHGVTKAQVGLGNVDNVKQYSTENPPVVAQASAPSDTSVIWVDTDDDSIDDTQFISYEPQTLTEAQKAQARLNLGVGSIDEVAAEVLIRLKTPVFGEVYADNTIILTGKLADGIYTLKYEDKDGNVTEIGTIEVGGDEYINWITEVGYKTDTKYSSSAGAEQEYPGCYLTGYIPVEKGQTVNIVNMTMDKNISDGNLCFGYWFDTSKENVKKIQINKDWTHYTFDELGAVWNENGYLTQFTVPADGFIRLQASYIGADSIITISQKIPEEEPAYTNLIQSAEALDSTALYNDCGYKNGYYLSSDSTIKFEGTDETTVLTGYIPYEIPENGLPDTLYIKGAQWQDIDHCRLFWFSAKNTLCGPTIKGAQTGAGAISTYFNIETLGDSYYKFTPKASGDSSVLNAQVTTSKNAKYFRISLVGTGENLIITRNQEIPEEEPTYTNLFDPDTATINTRMSGSNQTPKAADGYVMTADISLPNAIHITGSYDETTPYIAVPSAMWSGDANILGIVMDTGVRSGYVSAGVTPGTVDGKWTKIPIYNEWTGNITLKGITVSLYVSASAITESDIQDIKIYFNEIPSETTNWIKRSVESDGVTRYNGGQGWKADTRYSASSGIEKEEPGVYITGFIPVKKGDVVRMKNITMNMNNTNNYARNLCYFWGLPTGITITIGAGIGDEWGMVFDSDGNLIQFTIPEDYVYIVINASYIGDDSIITINQEIPEEDMGDFGSIDLIWAEGVKLDKTTGSEGSDVQYAASQMIDLVDGYTYTARQSNVDGWTTGGISICYYGEGGSYLGYEELWSSVNEERTKNFTPPDGTVSFRVRLFRGEIDFVPERYSVTYEKTA